MTPKPVAESICKICYDTSDGFHFGTLACRACAAFFRRSTVAKRRYVCRYNDRCKVEKAARCMCRACRLKKCLELGMKPEHVQDQRGRIRNGQMAADGNISKCDDQKAICSGELEANHLLTPVTAAAFTMSPVIATSAEITVATTSTVITSPLLPVATTTVVATATTGSAITATTTTTNTVTTIENATTAVRQNLVANETVSDRLPEIKHPSNAVPVIKTFRRCDEVPAIQIIEEGTKFFPDNVPTLKKIYSDYRQYKKFRKIATEVFNYYGYANNTKVLRELSLDEAKRLIRADVSVISVFINECLPGFKVLPEAEKIALFKTFLKTFLIIDGSFWTAKYFSSPKDDRCVIPFSGYIKLDVLADLFVSSSDSDGGEELKVVKPLFEKYKRLLRDSIVELNMTEVELLALLSIALWDNGIESLSQLTKVRAQDTRNILLKELYNYCLSIDHKNAPARYGTLLEYLKIVELMVHETEKKGVVFKILDIATGEVKQDT